MSTRVLILEAAADLASEYGPGGVTISAVAIRAGVTKGGVFHYFKTKEDLIRGLMDHVASGFEAELDRRASRTTYTKGLIELTIETATQSPRLLSAMLAAVMIEGALAYTIRARTEAWFQRMVAEGLAVPNARIVRAALDGVLLAIATGTEPISEDWLSELQEGLLAVGSSSALDPLDEQSRTVD